MRLLAVSLFGRIGPLACALAIAGVAVGSARIAHASVPADTLYGTSWGRIDTVDQNDGSITPLLPQPGSVFFGLAFDSAGRLFAAGCTDSGSPVSCGVLPDRLLMELDPLTGEIVDVIGPMTDESALSTIDPLTGAVTEVGGAVPVTDLDFSPLVLESVDIDIKPGGDPNAVNPMSSGVLPVAILGSDTFDVADVDAMTLTFGPGEAAPLHSSGGHAEDVNDDGYTDWVSHYRIEEVAVAVGDTELCLIGETLDGTPIEGCDTIVTVPYVGERWRHRVNRQR